MSSLPDAVLSEPLLPHRPLSPPEPPMSGVPSLAASLKPLLNPLQTEATPPASTIVEPPRSPNPSNPATNEKGTNVDADLISADGSTLGTADGEVNGQDENVELAPPPQIPPFSISPIPSSAAEQPALSPLPTDAPMPLTPKAQDEPPPVLAAGEIPPTVSTPNMITSEDQGMPIESARTPTSAMQTPRGEDILPDAFPTPADTRFDPIALLKTPIYGAAPDVPVEAISRSADGDQPPSDEPMEVDAVGEEEGRTSVDAAPGMESSVSTSSLKRAGEDLKGREEKRVKEDVQADNESTLQPPAPASAPAPAAADGAAPVPLLPWQSYTPPRPRPAGPTSTLTVTQHKHLLNAVRSLKKAKDAPGFLVPVDTVLFGIPHYHQVIPRPMDLGTVETKLFVSDPRGPPKDKSRMSKWDTSKGSYNSVNEAVEDVRQIWENTRKFNGPDHIVSQAATRLDDTFQTMLNNMPSEPTPAPAPAPAPAPLPSPVAGPSTTPTARRASVSQPPVIRRTSDGPDSRPKREIHPPPSKDLAYADGGIRKPKRRNDPQLQWASRTLKGFETSTKYFDAVSPFLYPVSQIISELPDYANLIKRPIDLNQIKDRMNDGDYEDVSQVNADLRLMTSNAMKFNPPGHAVHQAAQQFLQSWDEKWKTCPPKQEMRDGSEDPGAEDYDMDSEEETPLLRKLLGEKLDIERRIAEEKKAHIARRKLAKGSKAKPKGVKASIPRKHSLKASPGVNGNGHAKKPRKSKEMAYKDEDDEMDSEEEGQAMTLTQKQELAEKIQVAESDVLSKAIQIIQQSTKLGANNEEIELDIDSLPPRTVYRLYNLVCRGGRKPGRSKSQTALGQGKKMGRKGTGGVTRKHMNEQEEADRIRRMEAQLQSFEGGGMQGYGGGEETDSSEEESSDED